MILSNAVRWGQNSQINKLGKLVDTIYNLQIAFGITSIAQMPKERHILKGVSKNQPQPQSDDQNKPKNIFKLQGKKDLNPKPIPKAPQPSTISIQQAPMTSYRFDPTSQETQRRKWQYITKCYQLSSKAHYIYSLKNATLFLSYSLAEKTVKLVLDNKITFDYWAACCMFMAMKYEEIYPPRLRDLQTIVKAVIDLDSYWDAELMVWEYIGQDLNFLSLNTRLSEYLHAISKKERFFVFYLLQCALYKRSQFRNYTQKEIILSVMYIFSSQKLSLEPQEVIDGTPFERIEECARKIVMSQIEGQQSCNFIFKKYQYEARERVALKGTPHLDGLSNLLVTKMNEPEKPPKIIGFCPEYKESEMIEEKDEIEAEEAMKKRAEDLKFLKPRY